MKFKGCKNNKFQQGIYWKGLQASSVLLETTSENYLNQPRLFFKHSLFTQSRVQHHHCIMEIDGLGKRCALPECRRLDYLPVRCYACNLDFCEDHKLPASHSCTVITAREGNKHRCPECGVHVGAATGALERHLKSCRKRRDPKCAYCGKRDPLGVTCSDCGKQYCLEHRHLEVHNCDRSASVVNHAKIATKKKLFASLPKPSRRFANTRTAAQGDEKIEIEDRITCEVHFALDGNIPARYMFFSNRWSAGKILDDIAKRASLTQKRRWLYTVKANARGVNQLPNITPLRDLPFGTVESGDALVVAENDAGLPEAWVLAIAPRAAPMSRAASSRRKFSVDKNSCKVV